MSTAKRWSVGAAIAACGLGGVLIGCGGKKEETPKDDGKVQETGKSLSKNPLEAMKQLGQAAQKTEEAMKKAAEKKPVDPVKFDVLIPYLPKPAGWTASEPQGSTSAMGEFKITVVSNSYSKPAAEGSSEPAPDVRIEITDGGYVPMAYAGFQMMSQFSTESTDGYQKGVTVDGQPGFEKWDKKNRSSELWVLVADRYLVHLAGNAVEPATLREWLGQVDLKKIADLK